MGMGWKEKKTEPVTQEKKIDIFAKELERVTDEDLRKSLTEWWQYKKGYKQLGWQKLITLALSQDAKKVIAAIDKAISFNWKWYHIEDEHRGSGNSPPFRGNWQEYFWLLDGWCDQVKVLSRNEIRDHNMVSKREATEDVIRGIVSKNVVKYYKNPWALTESQAETMQEMIREYRDTHWLSYEDTPVSVIVGFLRKILLHQ